ncbi:hypothetical protein EV658_1514 [Phaeovulum veldkampii DSM 11550]|nr:hypothetical protein EV658_1514 [Phaeovulum veldkampii DSM 11550]
MVRAEATAGRISVRQQRWLMISFCSHLVTQGIHEEDVLDQPDSEA